MARTVVAIYDDFQTANTAVRDLVDNGFPRDNISLIANNTRGEYGYSGPDTATAKTTGSESVADETGAGAGVGAGIGAAIGGIGGLLVGLGALTIPGIGPVIAAGPLAVALSTLTGAGVGAVAGGVTGGLLGALIGLGIPEEEAGYYAEGVRRGGVLVTVQTEDENTERIMSILNHHDPIDINERVSQWRKEGWKGYDARNANSGQVADRPMGQQTGQPVNIPMTGNSTTQYDQGMGQTSTYGAEFNPQNPVYRDFYDANLASMGYPYDYYLPAYQYGYGLSANSRYYDRDWTDVEYDVQQDWEREHPGTWERFKGAIRAAWEDATRR